MINDQPKHFIIVFILGLKFEIVKNYTLYIFFFFYLKILKYYEGMYIYIYIYVYKFIEITNIILND